MSLIKKIFSRNDGVAAIEFVLCFPLMVVTIICVMEFGQAFWIQNALHYAVQQTARCITFTSNCSSVSTAQNYAASASGFNFDPSVFTVNIGVTCGSATGNLVSAVYPFQFNVYLYSYSFSLGAQACVPNPT